MMKLFALAAFCLALLACAAAENGCKNDESLADCKDTEYHTYVACIRKRMKRSLDCENSEEECEGCDESCSECDCDYCTVNSCQSKCNNCCPHNPPCTSHRCCHRTCHARCKSSSCRSECRRGCVQKVNGGSETTSTNTTVIEKSHHNITTVINLQNLVNNTNLIDVPVDVNTTNVHNITTYPGQSSSGIITNGTSEEVRPENCCYVVSPRQCVPKEQYPYVRCFHYRRKVCGPFCSAPIIHEQPHEVCDQTPVGTNCHQQIIYIPQPQPRCTYQSSWPYVACGVQQQQQQQQQPSCAGCYSHYASPYPQMPQAGCVSGCYDDGFGAGPYYRQGPFYRPGYAHAPSCYQTGTCGLYGYDGYGGYGYPAPMPAPYPAFGGFPGVGYPPYTYENSVHFETDANNVGPRAKEVNSSKERGEEVEETPSQPLPPPPQFIPMGFNPQFSALGYPYVPQFPAYYLPPEVDIQASISHPEKDGRYAQITITDKRGAKHKSAKLKEEENEVPENEPNGFEEGKEVEEEE